MHPGFSSCEPQLAESRNWLWAATGCEPQLAVSGNWLWAAIGCEPQLAVTRNWLWAAIGCELQLVVSCEPQPKVLSIQCNVTRVVYRFSCQVETEMELSTFCDRVNRTLYSVLSTCGKHPNRTKTIFLPVSSPVRSWQHPHPCISQPGFLRKGCKFYEIVDLKSPMARSAQSGQKFFSGVKKHCTATPWDVWIHQWTFNVIWLAG
jgi:hypothetical protein